MSDTTFVDGTTLTAEDWFNDLNRLHYTILGDPATLAALRVTLLPFLDSTALLAGSADATKKVRFEVDGLTTGTTRVITVPDRDLTLDNIGLNLIATAVASNSATVDFTSGITSAYDEYLVTLTNVIPANDDSALYARLSEDGGSTFKAGATDYAYAHAYIDGNAGAITAAGTSGVPQFNITSASISNVASSGGASGEVRIFAPAGTASKKHVSYDMSVARTNGGLGMIRTTGAGIFQLDTNAINGIRFLMSSGNITSGNFALYGVRKA